MAHQRLLEIAIREFGLKGLDGASTRGIAKAAGTAMSSITYHYGGKEGLYQAAAQHIADQMCEEMQPFLASIDDGADGPDDARAAIHAILVRMVGKMADEGSADRALFMTREQMNPTSAFDTIYGGVLGQMLERLANLVCTATERGDMRVARTATITLMGQVASLRAWRASCLKLLRKTEMDDEARGWFARQIALNTDAILDRLAAEPQEPA